ncbi:hypothetical protein GpartN1_g111.t1 [Galdieria partita]|uniref:SCD domain-containing protein n=1 Tax=Galdieria partita TaxID=83374 RepID=A0A9C7UM27_9RHOD|nr:hypothetical protein GpartN1_g111.t1 [Galdieria partita]
MVVLRGRNVEAARDPDRSESASHLVQETVEENFEEDSSQSDDGSGFHESQSADSANSEAQDDETLVVSDYSSPSFKKRKIENVSEANNTNDIVPFGGFESSFSPLFSKLHHGIDSVNILLRTLFEEVSAGKETSVLKDLYLLIIRTAFFPNASNWTESLQKELSEFLANWDMCDASLEKILTTFDESILSVRLCLTLKDKSSKRFRSRYEAFWKGLSKIAPRSLIDNQGFFNRLIDQLALFTTSNFRNLRYVATLSCFSLNNGFISSEESARSEHSLFEIHEAIPRSKQHTRASSSNKAANLTGIAEYLDKIFNKVFVLRYRDVAPEIRALSISYLGEWILNLPRSFLDDRFLKYIGWMLNDKASEVRMSSVHVIGNLLRIQENWPRMQLFLRRFRSRIFEMTQDKDAQVARNAVQVIELIMQVGGLVEEEKNKLFKVVATETRKPVQEAAQSITNQIVKDLTNREVGNVSATLGSHRNESSEILIRLARLFSDDKMRSTFLSNCIESLCKEISVLEDWDAYFSILRPEQNDIYSQEEKLTITKILLELSQTLSSKAAFVSSSSHTKSKRMGRRRTDEASTFQQLCRSILSNVISSLTYNQADPELLTFVVPLIRQVDENTYRLYCIPDSIRDIATKLKELFDRHTSSFLLLSECLLSLRHLAHFSDHSFRKEAEQVLSQLSNEIVSSLHDLALAFEAYSDHCRESTRKLSTAAISSTLLKSLAFIAYGSEMQEDGVNHVLGMCRNAETLVTFLESESCVLSFLRLAHFCTIQRWHLRGEGNYSMTENDNQQFEQNAFQLLKLQDSVCQNMLFIDQSNSKLLLYINIISCLQLYFYVRSHSKNENSSDGATLRSVLTSLAEKCSIFFIESLRDFRGSNISKPPIQNFFCEDVGLIHFFRCYTHVSEIKDFPSPVRCLSFSLLAFADPNIQNIGRRWLKVANCEDIARGLLEYLRHFFTEVKQLKVIVNELSSRFIRIDQLQELVSFISCFLNISFNIDDNYKVAADSLKNATDHILIPLARKLPMKFAEQCYEELLSKFPQLLTAQEDRYSFVLLLDTIREIFSRRNKERSSSLEENDGQVMADEGNMSIQKNDVV